MDIKSKDSKKFSFLAAGLSIVLAVVIFMAFYPAFKRQAGSYYTEPLRSDQMLEYFYFSNLLLYKNMLDKTQMREGEISFSDLYLHFAEEDVPRDEIYENGQYVLEGWTAEEVKEALADGMDSTMGYWKNIITNELAKRVDYCAIDHKTGEILKNTGRSIENLYKDKSAEAGEEIYDYYVMMTFDGTGNLVDLSVRDGNPDELLKNVQSFMDGKWLKDHFETRINHPLRYTDTVCVAGEEERLSWSVTDRPKDMTFIYACTNEQRENIHLMWRNSSFMSSYRWEVWQAYFDAGVAYAYWGILAVLAVTALLFSRGKRYCLHRLPGVKMHLEISITAIIVMLSAFPSLVVEMVYFVDSGIFAEFFREYLAYLPTDFYSPLAGAVSAIALILIFGSWYYFVTSLCGIFDIGPKEFLMKRSLIIKFLRRIVCGVKRQKDKLREEVLHVDLGKGAESTLRKLILINFVFLAVVSLMWMFGWIALLFYSAVLYVVSKKYIQRVQEQYRKLLVATRSIADGNLQTQFEEDWGVFESYKKELVKIQDGFKMAVEQEVKSQRMKTELITNVSHDLKTPLTAITTYIELMEDDNISVEQRKEYLRVLTKKSARLKFLIEDLFEVSKASSGNITLDPVEVDICNLMRQVYLEYEDRVEEAELIFRFQLPEDKVILRLDSQKTYRVFENLYVNIIKYAMPRTRVYVNARKTENGIDIELKNMSAAELNIPPEELTERFVRGDSARNTEGSGLGLAIARSFVELQGGRMKVEIDGDLFKVTINW